MQPGETIGFLDAPRASSLVDPRIRFQIVRISGNTVLGKNPLAEDSAHLPTYIYIPGGRFGGGSTREFLDPYQQVLANAYDLFDTFSSGTEIYHKK